jgi:hypothetical protein
VRIIILQPQGVNLGTCYLIHITRCRRLVLLELMYLSLKVVNYVISVCERHSMVLRLLLKLLQLLLHVLDFHVLHGLELLKLMGLNLGGLLSCPQKDTMPK